MITVLVNNKSFSVNETLVLNDLLVEQAYAEQKGIAVAVNNVVVTKLNWSQYKLNNNDKITIIKASQGG